MVSPPDFSALDWIKSDSLLSSINDNKQNNIDVIPPALNNLHSHSHPKPHTHSHPYDISHGHSHSYLEYNYTLINPVTHATSIDGIATTIINPENTHFALTKKEENKLIHLDPVPNFTEKSEIKLWLQKIFYPQGIEIVIERSDSTKVIFKCKASKRGKNAKEPVINEDTKEQLDKQSKLSSNNKKKKRSVSRFNVCPFRIRATYSLKRKKWSIVVLNNSHSHDLEFNPNSEEYKKFKAKLKDDNDKEAVKKFDELEYRKKANLPIQSSMIPCECGLTTEIQSFNIVLPNAASPSLHNSRINNVNSSSSIINNNNIIQKPSLKKKKESLLKKTTEKNLMSLHYNSDHHNTASDEKPFAHNISNDYIPMENSHLSDFLDDQYASTSISLAPTDNSDTTNLNMLPLTSTEKDTIMDLNEIDFTNIFTRSFSANNIDTMNPNINSSDIQSLDLMSELTPASSISLFHNEFNSQTPILNDSHSRLNSNHTISLNYANSQPTPELGLSSPARESHFFDAEHEDSNLRESISSGTVNGRQFDNHQGLSIFQKSLDDAQKELTMFSNMESQSGTDGTTELYDLDKFNIIRDDLTIVKPEAKPLSNYKDIDEANSTQLKVQDSDDQMSNWLSTLNHHQIDKVIH